MRGNAVRVALQRLFELTGTAERLPFVTRALRVLLVDDDPAELTIMQDWLEGACFVAVVGTAGDEAQAMRHLRAQRPDVVVSDTLRGPADAGFLERLRAQAPDVAIVVHSGYRAYQLGPEIGAIADAVVEKDSERAGLAEALARLSSDRR